MEDIANLVYGMFVIIIIFIGDKIAAPYLLRIYLDKQRKSIVDEYTTVTNLQKIERDTLLNHLIPSETKGVSDRDFIDLFRNEFQPKLEELSITIKGVSAELKNVKNDIAKLQNKPPCIKHDTRNNTTKDIDPHTSHLPPKINDS